MPSQNSTGARLAVDIGGTFTDIVLETGNRRLTGKVLTTLRFIIGGSAWLNSTLPRTHSAVFGGAHTEIVATDRRFVAARTLTVKSRALRT